MVRAFIDGASQGNPGPAGIGVAFFKDGVTQPVATLHKFIGETTNNVAEYTALIYALQEALIRGFRVLKVCTDSELVAKQVTGAYKVREATLQPLHDQVRHLMEGLESCELQVVPREQNRVADQLATAAIEERFDRAVKRAQ